VGQPASPEGRTVAPGRQLGADVRHDAGAFVQLGVLPVVGRLLAGLGLLGILVLFVLVVELLTDAFERRKCLFNMRGVCCHK